MKKLDVIILAAGRGTRMKSALPKVMHKVCGLPMVYYPVISVSSLPMVGNICLVLGYRRELVESYLEKEFPGRLRFVYQNRLDGSAKAVQSAMASVDSPYVMIMCADSPLPDSRIIKDILSFHIRSKAYCTLVSKKLQNPHGMGRVIKDSKGNVKKIVEQVNLSSSQKQINEINTGVYVFHREALSLLNKIKINAKKNEYFLTDIIEILDQGGKKINSFLLKEDACYFSVNRLLDLPRAEQIVRSHLIERHILRGVRILDPDTTFLGPKTIIGKETIIYPFTFLENNVKIGRLCSVGPFCRIREGTVLADKAEIGNFAEVARSRISALTKVKHFSYIGDTEIDAQVNIGAGTVIANFDGKKKNKTFIGKQAFIGSDSVLVAPLKIGKKALTGAGSVVLNDVPAGGVVAGVPAKPLNTKK